MNPVWFLKTSGDIFMSPWQPISLFKNSYRKPFLQRAQETVWPSSSWPGACSVCGVALFSTSQPSWAILCCSDSLWFYSRELQWCGPELTVNAMIPILFLYYIRTCVCLLFVLDCQAPILFGISLCEVSLFCSLSFCLHTVLTLFCYSEIFSFEASIHRAFNIYLFICHFLKLLYSGLTSQVPDYWD